MDINFAIAVMIEKYYNIKNQQVTKTVRHIDPEDTPQPMASVTLKPILKLIQHNEADPCLMINLTSYQLLVF